MDKKTKAGTPKKDTRSKAQLLQALAQTNDRLEKKEIELARCKQELQGQQTRLDEQSDLHETMQRQEDALKKARAKIARLESQVKKQRKKQAALQKQTTTASKAEEQLNLALARIEELEAQNQSLVKKSESIARKNKSLQNKIRELTPQQTAKKPEPMVHVAAEQNQNARPEELVVTTAAAPEKRAPFLEKIHFVQNQQPIATGNPLQARQPFLVCTRLAMENPPDRERLDAESPNYSIQIKAKKRATGHAISYKSHIGSMRAGQHVYEDKITMPKCAAGEYVLDVVAIAPAARLAEHKEFELCVS